MKLKPIAYLVLLGACLSLILVSNIHPSPSGQEQAKAAEPAAAHPAAAGPQGETRDVMVGAHLRPGFDMGVNTSGGRTDWLEPQGDYFRMSYPSNQDWGAVFVTVGRPTRPPRTRSMDFSHCQQISVELRGERGSIVSLGIKDKDQPDDGSEPKVEIHPTANWTPYTYPLSRFAPPTDLSHAYVVAELVFDGPAAQTVYFRNIKYLGCSQ
jgi:hypothetical protein